MNLGEVIWKGENGKENNVQPSTVGTFVHCMAVCWQAMHNDKDHKVKSFVLIDKVKSVNPRTGVCLVSAIKLC